MCNGLEDYIEINENVVGKIPKSVNGQNCILFYGKDLYTWREFQIFKTTKQMDYIHIHGLFYY